MAAGSAVAMIGANIRFGSSNIANSTGPNGSRMFQCHPGGTTEALVIFSLGAMGMGANIALMALILSKRQLRRWSQGLLFHQAMVDCARAAILLPLGISIYRCQPVNKCSLVETAFLLLVTVSTVNMLTTVLNDSPVFPEDDEDGDVAISGPLLLDSAQCVFFGTFMIWFASITINLGPTFLSGALAANTETNQHSPSCPLVHGPFRHYVLNVLWIIINVICVVLTLFHLHKLHRDLTKANVEAVRVAGLVTTLVNVTGGAQGGPLTRPGGALEEHRRMRNYLQRMEREGVQRVNMFLVITAAYVLFWGPLFLVTLLHHPLLGNHLGYEITLHVAYVHAFVNPTLFLVLHRGLRQAAFDICCGCWSYCLISKFFGGRGRNARANCETMGGSSLALPLGAVGLASCGSGSEEDGLAVTLPPPPPPRVNSLGDISLLKPPLLPAPPPAPSAAMIKQHQHQQLGDQNMNPWLAASHVSPGPINLRTGISSSDATASTSSEE